MKKYIYGAILALFLALVGYCQYEHHQAVKYQELYSVAAANNKAYESDLAANSEQAKMYQLTVDQLHSSNDSLIQELLQVQKERKIKDSELQAMAYQLSKATRRDTITMKDTIFVDAGNVWLMKADEARPGGDIDAKRFGKDIALGTGVGLRYDLDFLVLRFDIGVGIHAPYDTGRSGYYNMRRFWDSLGFHIAVGYPF